MKNFNDIDLGRLEEHWLQQPRLYGKKAARLADAKLELSTVKAQLEVTEAEVKLHIRRYPNKHGFKGRVTDSVVKELVLLDKTYRDAQRKVHDAQHVVDVLTGAINTLEHRKRTLENLVTLYGQDYFSKPKVSPSNKFKSDIESKSFQRGTKLKRRRKKPI